MGEAVARSTNAAQQDLLPSDGTTRARVLQSESAQTRSPISEKLLHMTLRKGVRWYPKALLHKTDEPPSQPEGELAPKRTTKLSLFERFRDLWSKCSLKEQQVGMCILYKVRVLRLEPLEGRSVPPPLFQALRVGSKDVDGGDAGSHVQRSLWPSTLWRICLVAIWDTSLLVMEGVDSIILAMPVITPALDWGQFDSGRDADGRLRTLPLSVCQLISDQAGPGSLHEDFIGASTELEDEKKASGSPILVLETPFLGLVLQFSCEAERSRFAAEFDAKKRAAMRCVQLYHSAVRFVECLWLRYRWRTLVDASAVRFGRFRGRRDRSFATSTKPMPAVVVAERFQALYRAVQARKLRARLAVAWQVARQKGMNVRIEGQCHVGASLVTKAWLKAGRAQVQWLRAGHCDSAPDSSNRADPIPGANGRVYTCSGEDLSHALIARWIVCSPRTGETIDQFEVQTRPVTISASSKEGLLLQRLFQLPQCRVRCVYHQLGDQQSTTLKDNETYLMVLRSDDICLYPQEPERESRDSAENSCQRPLSVSTGADVAGPCLLRFPYRALYTSSDVFVPASGPLLLVADLTHHIYLVLAARSFAERNVLICIIQQLVRTAAPSVHVMMPPAGIARFALQAAEAAQRLTASSPMRRQHQPQQPQKQAPQVIRQSDAEDSDSEPCPNFESSGLWDAPMLRISRDDPEMRREGRSMELARAGWQALGRGFAGLMHTGKTIASRTSSEQFRSLASRTRANDTSQRVRAAIRKLYQEHVRGPQTRVS